MIAKRSVSLVVLTLADLSLIVVGFLFIALMRQKTTFHSDLVRIESQRDAAMNERDETRRLLAQARTVSDASVVNQEILGINGGLSRLVFVIDKSGSMGRGQRWTYIQGIIDKWLRYLPIESCALIVFDDTVEAFPSRGGYLDLVGPDGPRNRAALLGHLAKIKPHGNTNTLLAVDKAYSLDPTAIVLATDGFPDLGTNRFDAHMADAVAELSRKHGQSVPVHVLALGDYFDERLGRFLRSIADATGGTFIAR